MIFFSDPWIPSTVIIERTIEQEAVMANEVRSQRTESNLTSVKIPSSVIESIKRETRNETSIKQTKSDILNTRSTLNKDKKVVSKSSAKSTTSKLGSIFHALPGRMGNCLYGLASALGIGYHNNRSVMIADDSNLRKLMNIFPNMEVNHGKVPKHLKTIKENNLKVFDPKLFDLTEIGTVKIGVFLQSFKYFENATKIIHDKIFSHWERNLVSKATEFIENVKRQYLINVKQNQTESTVSTATSVCLHMRRTDYLTKFSVDIGRVTPSAGDLHHAMDYMENMFNNVVFIVASDDQDWCTKHLNRSNVYFSKFESANQDFTLMSHCDHMIMSVGTFGWWAGWLTAYRGGTVLYYGHIFVNNSKIYKQCNRQDFIPPNWLAYTNTSIIKSRDLDPGCW